MKKESAKEKKNSENSLLRLSISSLVYKTSSWPPFHLIPKECHGIGMLDVFIPIS